MSSVFTVKHEMYRNDYTKRFGNLYFADLDQLKTYLFNGMIADPVQNMHFPQRRAHEEGYGWVEAITFRREEGGDDCRIHTILYGEKCVFSDGVFTGGKRFCAKAMEEFLNGCQASLGKYEFGELED